MSDINKITQVTDQAMANGIKQQKARKPKIVKAPGSFRFGVKSVAPTETYGPCAFEVTIATPNAIGADDEVEPIREFAKGFGQFPEFCVVKGYGVYDSAWTVELDLNTGGKDVDDAFVSAMLLKMKVHFETTPVLKAGFASGKATYRVLNGGSTVETGGLI